MVLPNKNCLIAAITTPITGDFRPDLPRLGVRASMLMDQGCDGIALFGTTGEGATFSLEDRIATLEGLAPIVNPDRLLVSVGALSFPDVVKLSLVAIKMGVHGILLMPPCMYRGAITEEGTFRYFATAIEQISLSDYRLYLYHFPEICGAPVTPQVIHRLVERYPGVVAGVKDSGGDLDFTQELLRRFSHLSIFTGSEIHLPEVLATGARGTICGLANVMPRLLRAMMDIPTAFDRRKLVPHILRGDMILSRHTFISSAKSVVAAVMADPEWLRVMPPMTELPLLERQRLVEDFTKWNAGLDPIIQSLSQRPALRPNVINLRRA